MLMSSTGDIAGVLDSIRVVKITDCKEPVLLIILKNNVLTLWFSLHRYCIGCPTKYAELLER